MKSWIMLASATGLLLLNTSLFGVEGGKPNEAGRGAGQPYGGTRVGDVVIATVTQVSKHQATNGNPPQLRLDIHEVLRGEATIDRSRAIWSPPPHDIDYGEPEQNPRFKAWQAKPLVAPKVGTKLVLWGSMVAETRKTDSPRVFHVNPYHRYDYSLKRRQWAIGEIRAGENERLVREQDQAKEKQRWESALNAWRAKFTAEELRRLTGKADVVVVGKVVGGISAPDPPRQGYTVQVSRLLKGKLRQEFQAEKSFVGVVVIPELGELLYPRDRTWVLFLSSAGRINGVPDIYHSLNDDAGLVVADDAALKVIAETLVRE